MNGLRGLQMSLTELKITKRQRRDKGPSWINQKEFKSKELERVELQNGQREKEEDLEMRKVRFEMANENQIVAPSFAIWSKLLNSDDT